jgi:hypothetical protein
MDPSTNRTEQSYAKKKRSLMYTLFRHSFRDRLRAVQCPSDIIDQLGGWKTPGVGHGYGEGCPLEVLESWMQKIKT